MLIYCFLFSILNVYLKLADCVQLYRATWVDPEPPAVPKWRQRLAQEQEGEEGNRNVRPLRPLEPHRDTLVITLSDSQWSSLKDHAKNRIEKAFDKANHYLDQISKLSET